ncbi:hypothetical protein SAMN05660971_02704 [Halomonas cupida]|uniref:Uncharacterized protein n=1 Tax=Halomonas cupida TaxID=44933 RepID=A0A1M7HVX1_9GAMM|nr:hypothetical protein SAMN05660971_02704 [Halomonas cupida]
MTKKAPAGAFFCADNTTLTGDTIGDCGSERLYSSGISASTNCFSKVSDSCQPR